MRSSDACTVAASSAVKPFDPIRKTVSSHGFIESGCSGYCFDIS